MNNIYIYLKKSFISLYTTVRKFDEFSKVWKKFP